jgi:hypothetical protein
LKGIAGVVVHCPPGPHAIGDCAEGAHATASSVQVQGGTFDVPIGMQLPPPAVEPLTVTLGAAPHPLVGAPARLVQAFSGIDGELPQVAPRQPLILANVSFGAPQTTFVGLSHLHVHCAGSFEGLPPSNTGAKPAPHVGAPDAPVHSASGPVQPFGTGGVHVVPTGHPASAPASKPLSDESLASLAEVVSAGASVVLVSSPPPAESAPPSTVASPGDC